MKRYSSQLLFKNLLAFIAFLERKQYTFHLRVDTTNVQGDTTKVRVDATKVQGDTTKVRVDATKVRVDATNVRVDATKVPILFG
ncbi:hypothetical protein [Nostoc sphaeroides]|nr:hypothetical protein [Nostoc sphaeroides]